MPSSGQNLTLSSGRTSYINIPILDQSGNGYDMTGGSCFWVLGPGPGQKNLLTRSTNNQGVTLTETGSVWTAQIYLSPLETASLSGGPYDHELTAYDRLGDVVTTTTGTITFQPAQFAYGP